MEADRYSGEDNSRTFLFKVTVEKPCVNVAADVTTEESISYFIGDPDLEFPLVESAVADC